MNRLLNVWVMCCALIFAPRLAAQETLDVAAAFQKLQSVETSDKARDTLLKQGANDTQAKKYLSAKLPVMIEVGYQKGYKQWSNAVSLAGGLQIVETAPALAKWIGLDNVGSETSAARFQRLETNPAAKALSEIGDPAIPTLKEVLEHGSYRERQAAYLALNLINSPSAKAAIHARVDREDDPRLRQLIRKTPE